ncbi:MAG: hypothetical protein L0206_17095 [Actinobacteria bacterium]|nr:hypothetical protein [Actinomycetota bacterium]
MRDTTAILPDTDQLRLSGTKPVTSGIRPRTYAAGRVCGAEGCRTVLSRYNRSELCWQHEPRRPIGSAARGRGPDDVVVLDDLLPRAS